MQGVRSTMKARNLKEDGLLNKKKSGGGDALNDQESSKHCLYHIYAILFSTLKKIVAPLTDMNLL